MTPLAESDSGLSRDLIDRGLRLSPEDRGKFAHLLLESLDDAPPDDPGEVRKAWGNELSRRIGEIERGEVEPVDAFEALDDLDRELRESDATNEVPHPPEARADTFR